MDKKTYQILVVDDELFMCEILNRILANAGYNVITASDGKMALQLTKEHEPDLILLDIMMPGINGREVCRIVKEFSPSIKIIYFSAKMEQDPEQLDAIYSESDGFIAKPATGTQILTTVRSVLDKV